MIDCMEMREYRATCILGPFVTAYQKMSPHFSSVKIMALFLNDTNPEDMKQKALALYHMKVGWHSKMNINL